MMENPTFRPPTDPAALGGRGARESVIDQECFFEGTFRTPGNMRIEGTYQGQIECQGTLLIAESGNVNARIAAGSVIVAGQLSGEAQCENRFELLRTARASGTIVAKTTIVHDGAFFEGEVRMGGDATTAREPARAIAGAGAPRIMPAAPPARQEPAPSPLPETATEPGESPAAVEASMAPRTNGRRGAGRDVLPNRTGEP